MEKFTNGVRSLLGLSIVDLTPREISELFKAVSNGQETLNFTALESFVACHSDKVSSHFVFIP